MARPTLALLALCACPAREALPPHPVVAAHPSGSAGPPLASASTSASATPVASADPSVCAPRTTAKALEVLGCESVCVGNPLQRAQACLEDDSGALIQPFWLPRVLTLSVDGKTVLRVPLAFGPLDPITKGDFSRVRLRAELAGDGLRVEIADDPARSCAAAKKSPSYTEQASFRQAVARICAARGSYVWSKGRFERAP